MAKEGRWLYEKEGRWIYEEGGTQVRRVVESFYLPTSAFSSVPRTSPDLSSDGQAYT
jgi:hypothetical protein